MTGRVVLVTSAGKASGAKAAAAALACAGSEPDRAGLLIDVGGRAPRPTLVASAGARELEERLALHLPGLRAVARGQCCHLAVPDERDALDPVRAAIPLPREAVAVVHLPPGRFRAALDEPGIAPTAVLLRADLEADRALVALAARELIERGLALKVLERPLGWISAREALFGVSRSGRALPSRLVGRLLPPVKHGCYSGFDDPQADPARTAQQERRDHASAR